MHNPASVLENDTPTDHRISARRPDLIIIHKEKRICKIVDFAFPADHRIKLKECEKKDKYLDLARELIKLSNMKVTIIPIVIGAFSTVTKGLLKGLEDLEVGGRVETIQTTALLGTARLGRVLETWEDFIIIIIKSRHQHGYPWPSLTTPLYRPLLPAGLQEYIPYRHRAAVCRLWLVVLPLLVHVKGSTAVHRLWARSYFSGSVLHVWFV